MAKIVATYTRLNALPSYTLIRSSASYSHLKSSASYSRLNAAEVILDYDTKNRYFSGDNFSFSDLAALAPQKNLTDSIGAFTDAIQSVTVGKGFEETIGMGDFAFVLLELLRDFADSVPVIDAQTLSSGLFKAETLGLADIATTFISKSESDVASIGEQAAVGISKPLTDSASLSDQFSRAAVFQRVFTDSFALDDFTDVDAITKDSIAAKNNVIGFSDVQSFVTDKPFQDAVSFAEQSVAAFAKGLSYTASITESIQITTASLASSVLNASVLNGSLLNN